MQGFFDPATRCLLLPIFTVGADTFLKRIALDQENGS